MRLLLVTSVFPSPRRPVKGTFNRELVAALRAAGDEVRVVVPIPWTDLLVTRPVAPPDDEVRYPVWWYPPRLAHATHHRWMSRRVLPAILRAASGWDPDLVLGYWTHPDGTVALEAARRLGIPGVIMAGGSDIHLLPREAARRAVIVDTLCTAHRVLTVGASLRDAAIELGVPAERVGVFARGVHAARFHPGPRDIARERLRLPADRRIALWVGRMVPVKGLDVLLEAWRTVARHPGRPLLLLIGDGDARRALERQAAALGDTVRFVGSVEHDELPDWYRAADVMVLPSRSEGTPNVLLEALACGTPFIASDVGSVRELMSDGCRVVPPGDATALADALLAWAAQGEVATPPVATILDRDVAIAALRDELHAVLGAATRPVATVA